MSEDVNEVKSESLINKEELTQAAKVFGRAGGLAKSERKSIASKKNGSMPCRPGKKRGRPFKTLP